MRPPYGHTGGYIAHAPLKIQKHTPKVSVRGSALKTKRIQWRHRTNKQDWNTPFYTQKKNLRYHKLAPRSCQNYFYGSGLPQLSDCILFKSSFNSKSNFFDGCTKHKAPSWPIKVGAPWQHQLSQMVSKITHLRATGGQLPPLYWLQW